jgi:hypothetical protein
VFKEKGVRYLSARTDVSLYDGPVASKESKKVNIELKANNPPFEHFRKDFEKLVRERLDGVWFHLLKNIDSGTLPSVFGKIEQSFQALKQYLDGRRQFILFALCVLEKKQQRLIQGVLEIGSPWQDICQGIERLFAPSAPSNLDIAGWKTYQPGGTSLCAGERRG